MWMACIYLTRAGSISTTTVVRISPPCLLHALAKAHKHFSTYRFSTSQYHVSLSRLRPRRAVILDSPARVFAMLADCP
jgi:hypothetical protein